MLNTSGAVGADAIRMATVITRREAARELWMFCDKDARELLLCDENTTVRNEAIYSRRDEQIKSLKRKNQVTVADLATLDRLGRCAVCDQLWQMCTPEARDTLLHDAHHFVRSCATIAAGAASTTEPGQ